MPSFKTESVPMTIEDALEGFVNDLEELKDEMGGWRDNLSGTALEGTAKYEEVESAADDLESAHDSAEDAVKELLELLPDEAKKRMVDVAFLRPYGRRENMLDAALPAVQEHVEHERGRAEEMEEGEAKDELLETVQDAESHLDDVESVKDDAGAVDFPGMY